MTWVHNGSRVYNAAAPVAWADLDLKLDDAAGPTGHPSAHTLALLKVVPGAGSSYVAFRTKGSTDNTYVTVTGGHGCAVAKPDSATSDAVLIFIPTDSAGLVQWKAQAASAMEIWLVGYVEATAVDLVVRASGAMPTVWTTLDLTQDVLAAATGITGEALSYLWFERTGGSQNDWATRPADPGYGSFLGGEVQGGSSQGGYGIVTDVEGIGQKTDTSGEIEILGVPPVSNEEIRLASFVQDVFASGDIEVYAAAPPPTSWTTLDMSAYIGSQKALVMIQVHMENSGGVGLQGVAFRTPGDASDYLPAIFTEPMGVACSSLNFDKRTIVLVEASSGSVEWISSSTLRDVDLRLVGVIPENLSTPNGANPSPTDLLLTSDTDISFELTDSYGLDMSTLVITATPAASPPITVYTGGAWQTGWGGLISEQAPIFGSYPTKAAVRINTFSDAFVLSSPRRYTMSVAVTNILGQDL